MNEQYLIENGWWKSEHDLWLNKFMKDVSRGGYTLNQAIKIQGEHELIDKNGTFYYYYSTQYGFDYSIGKYTEKHGMLIKTNFNHLSKEDAKKCVELFNSGIDTAIIDAPRQKFNKLVIFKEEYGERHFHVSCLEDLHKVAIKIFKERDEEGYWYVFSEMKEEEKPEFSKEDDAKLKNNELKESILDCWKRYESDLKYREEVKHEKKLYSAAKSDTNGNVVLSFLEKRKENEYENWEIINFEEY